MKKEFEDTLMNVYLETYYELIEEVMKTLCFGCRYMKESQRDHDVCCMMDKDEFIDVCLSEMEQVIDHNCVYAKSLARFPSMVFLREIGISSDNGYVNGQWFASNKEKIKAMLL